MNEALRCIDVLLMFSGRAMYAPISVNHLFLPQVYTKEKVNTWCGSIMDSCLKELAQLSDPQHDGRRACGSFSGNHKTLPHANMAKGGHF